MKKIAYIIMFLFLSISIYSFFHMNKSKDIQAINGVMFLNEYNFEESGNINLDGQWEIYDNELLTPNQLEYRTPSQYLTIPGNLKTQLSENHKGYMTLRLKISAQEDIVYGLRIKGVLSASKVWVNGVLQEQVGKVGTSYEDEKAIYLPIYSYFTSKDGQIEIVIQTSNYREIFPEVKSMEFGLKDSIINESIFDLGIDFIIIGGLLVIELLFLSLYKRMKNNKSYLLFSILCLFIQLRCLFLNERIIVHFFPNMPFEVLSKTAALTYYLWIPIYVFFIKEVFGDIPKRTIITSLIFSVTFASICLVTNNTFYDKLSYYGELVVIIIVIDILIFLIKKVRKCEENSSISLIAFTCLIVTAANDILLNNGFSHINRYVFQIGMFIFVLLETYSITINYNNQINKVKMLKEENEIIYERSIRDSLTNLYNRQYIESILDNIIDMYNSEGIVFTLMMLDIDYFKKINDTYGHLCGDKVLLSISNVLMKTLRNTDYIGRYGGEEFIVMFPSTGIDEAIKIAENIRENIEELSVDEGIKVTISGGLYENKENRKYKCIQNADELLYLAKERGRNRIEVSRN